MSATKYDLIWNLQLRLLPLEELLEFIKLSDMAPNHYDYVFDSA